MYIADAAGCGADACVASIIGIANPLIWWAATLATVYLVYRFARYREWQAGAILLGIAGTYLPWLLYVERTVFHFYTIAYEPFALLALTYVLGLVLGRPDDLRWRREQGIATVAVYLAVTAGVSVFFYPLWSAMPVSPEFRQLHFWLPGWG
jgi:dolichyl-phosphate-mannose-protein mannosyltransferase